MLKICKYDNNQEKHFPDSPELWSNRADRILCLKNGFPGCLTRELEHALRLKQ